MSDGAPTADQLYERAACGLILTDVNGMIRRVNRTFCNWIECEPEDLLGKLRVQDLLTVGAQLFFQTHWSPLMQMQQSVSEVKMDVRLSDGRRIPMLFNGVRDTTGPTPMDHIAAVVATDRQKYEQELLKARNIAQAAHERQLHEDRRKDEFLATLAHELRNPLAPMQNVAHILKMMRLHDPKLNWARDVLDRQVKQMTHLVDDLLDVSRITQNKVRLRIEHIDLIEALKTAIEAAQPMMDSAAHVLSFDFPSTSVMIDADTTRVAQMVVNLLNNAAKYTPDGGQIKLAVRQFESMVEVLVTDNGVGISEEQLRVVFDMFSQVTPSLQRTEGGLGIGLALVRGLALLHGGAATATSQGIGLGSEFVITLPRVQPISMRRGDSRASRQ